MLGVLWNDPGINPHIGTFFWYHVFQIGILPLGVDGFTGVDDANGGLIANHFVSHLVDNVGLHKRLLLDQQLLGRLQFIQVGGIKRVAEIFQRDSKRVAHAVLHQDIILVFLIPQYGPAVDRLIHHGLVIEDTYRSPAVWHGVLVLRVELPGLIHISIADIPDIWDVVKINLCQQVIFYHSLYHVVGRADHVISNGAGLDLGIHDLVGLVFLIDDLDPRLFLEHGDSLRVHIFSPIVDNHLIIASCGCLGAIEEAAHDYHHCHHDGNDLAKKEAAGFMAPYASGGNGFVLIRLFIRRDVDQNEQQEHGQEEYGGQRVHFRLNAFSDFAVYLGGQGIHSRALGKMRDDKVIQRHGKGQQESG